MIIRDLLVTDIRCPATGCGAEPGVLCGWSAADGALSHQERIDEHAELVRAGWRWQEVDPTDYGARRGAR